MYTNFLRKPVFGESWYTPTFSPVVFSFISEKKLLFQKFSIISEKKCSHALKSDPLHYETNSSVAAYRACPPPAPHAPALRPLPPPPPLANNDTLFFMRGVALRYLIH